jgi:hypothetical protein
VDVEVGAVLGGDVLAALLVEVGGGAPVRRVRAVTALRQRWVIAIEKKENSIIIAKFRTLLMCVSLCDIDIN